MVSACVSAGAHVIFSILINSKIIQCYVSQQADKLQPTPTRVYWKN